MYNKTQSLYVITNAKGEFSIQAAVKDTISFSALTSKVKEVIVTQNNLGKKQSIILQLAISELNPVYIKPKLPVNMLSGINNFDPQVSALSLGLPNASVKRLTVEERRLYTAKSGFIDPLINAITGKTKRLKKQLVLAKKSKQEEIVYNDFQERIITEWKIPKEDVYNFIFFASDDKRFKSLVNSKNDLKIYSFLEEKAVIYLKLKK